MSTSSTKHRFSIDNTAPFVIVIVVALLVAVRPIDSLDYWTHLAFGRAYLAAWSIDIAEPFLLYAGPGSVDNTEWPFQVLLYLARSVVGDSGISLLVALTVVAIFAPVLRLCNGCFQSYERYLLAALTAAAIYVAWFRFLPRPEILAYVLLTTSLVLTHQWVRAPDWKRLLAILAIMAIWIPLHITWSVGILFWAAFLLSQTDTGFLRHLFSSPGYRGYCLILGLIMLAGIFGAGQLAWEVISGLQKGGRMASISEMRPTWEFPSLAAPFYVFSIVALIFTVGRSHRRIARIGLWFMALVLGSVVVRNVAFSAIIMTYGAAAGLCSSGSHFTARLPPGPVKAVTVGVVVMLVASILNERGFDSVVGLRRDLYPVDAAAFVKNNRLAAPVFNNFDSGAYLNWAWSGDIKTFIDGRALGGDTLLRDHQMVIEARNPQPILDRHQIRTILIQAAYRNSGRVFPVVGWLLRQPDWELVHADDALVFTRRHLHEKLVPIPEAEAWRYVLQYINVLESISDEMVHAPFSKGVAYFHMGELPDARAAFDKASRLYPDIAMQYRLYIQALERMPLQRSDAN